jgi:serine phosphatase RsbU (regulator of sigma subunit)
VIYTDGLTEAVQADGTLTGVEPLLASLPEWVSLGAAEIAAHLLEIASLRDDLTLVVVKKQEH